MVETTTRGMTRASDGDERIGGASAAASTQPRATQVLVNSYGYLPEVLFRIQQQLQQSTVVRVLRRPDGSRVPEIVQPSEYNGYIIEYRMQADPRIPGITTFLYTRTLLDTTERYRLLPEAEMFSAQLNLLETVAIRIG